MTDQNYKPARPRSKILFADHHTLFREVLAYYLNSKGFDHVDGVGTLEETISTLQGNVIYDIVIVNLEMPGMDGLKGVKLLMELCGDIPVAVFTGSENPAFAKDVIEVGAKGYIPKTVSSKSITTAIGLMLNGSIYVPYEVMSPSVNAGENRDLTPREREVLYWISEGLSNKEIGLKLNLQEVSIKAHVKNLNQKLAGKNRTHLAMIAKNNGLI